MEPLSQNMISLRAPNGYRQLSNIQWLSKLTYRCMIATINEDTPLTSRTVLFGLSNADTASWALLVIPGTPIIYAEDHEWSEFQPSSDLMLHIFVTLWNELTRMRLNEVAHSGVPELSAKIAELVTPPSGYVLGAIGVFASFESCYSLAKNMYVPFVSFGQGGSGKSDYQLVWPVWNITKSSLVSSTGSQVTVWGLSAYYTFGLKPQVVTKGIGRPSYYTHLPDGKADVFGQYSNVYYAMAHRGHFFAMPRVLPWIDDDIKGAIGSVYYGLPAQVSRDGDVFPAMFAVSDGGAWYMNPNSASPGNASMPSAVAKMQDLLGLVMIGRRMITAVTARNLLLSMVGASGPTMTPTAADLRGSLLVRIASAPNVNVKIINSEGAEVLTQDTLYAVAPWSFPWWLPAPCVRPDDCYVYDRWDEDSQVWVIRPAVWDDLFPLHIALLRSAVRCTSDTNIHMVPSGPSWPVWRNGSGVLDFDSDATFTIVVPNAQNSAPEWKAGPSGVCPLDPFIPLFPSELLSASRNEVADWWIEQLTLACDAAETDGFDFSPIDGSSYYCKDILSFMHEVFQQGVSPHNYNPWLKILDPTTVHHFGWIQPGGGSSGRQDMKFNYLNYDKNTKSINVRRDSGLRAF